LGADDMQRRFGKVLARADGSLNLMLQRRPTTRFKVGGELRGDVDFGCAGERCHDRVERFVGAAVSGRQSGGWSRRRRARR
jgi:hypothetical protein